MLLGLGVLDGRITIDRNRASVWHVGRQGLGERKFRLVGACRCFITAGARRAFRLIGCCSRVATLNVAVFFQPLANFTERAALDAGQALLGRLPVFGKADDLVGRATVRLGGDLQRRDFAMERICSRRVNLTRKQVARLRPPR